MKRTPDLVSACYVSFRITPTSQLSDEQRETDADRSEEGGSVLLGCEHEDAEDEFKGQEHLNEQALHDRCVATQACAHCEGAREKTRDNGSCSDTCNNLRYDEQPGLEPSDGLNETHGDSDLDEY